MRKQLLLLPSAHSAVLISGDHPWVYRLQDAFEKVMLPLFVFGVLVALLGGLDLARRASAIELPQDALNTAFAPAASLR